MRILVVAHPNFSGIPLWVGAALVGIELESIGRADQVTIGDYSIGKENTDGYVVCGTEMIRVLQIADSQGASEWFVMHRPLLAQAHAIFHPDDVQELPSNQ